ncbi:hypothetical protein HQ535_07640 [bacterium]|nr:hypothetical protein [bacterium]
MITLNAPGLWKPDSDPALRGVHRFDKRYWAAVRGSHKPSRKKLAKLRRRAICAHCTRQARAAAKAKGNKARSVGPVIHPPEDPLAGIPIHPDTFDYQAAAAWNWNLGDLLHATITYLERIVGHPIEYCRIVEWSRRGVAHVHLLVNARISDSEIRQTIEAINAIRGHNQGWGEVFDVTRFRTDTKRGVDGEMRRLTAYLAKYLTKNTTQTIYTAARNHPDARQHHHKLQEAARAHARANARSRPGGPCPTNCGGKLRPSGDGTWLACIPPALGRTAPCAFETRNLIDHYTAQHGLRTQRLTKSWGWATEQRQSRTRPDTELPLWRHTHRRGWEPKPLTYRSMRRLRHRYAATQAPPDSRPAVSGKWIWTSTAIQLPTPTLNRPGQPNAPPHTTANTRP